MAMNYTIECILELPHIWDKAVGRWKWEQMTQALYNYILNLKM